MKISPLLLVTIVVCLVPLDGQSNPRNDFPVIPDDLMVSLFAKDPLVRNPCAITFDKNGRICVGMGPQYRNPKPETSGDSVWILIDKDQDGSAESRKEFASGFNAIQGLAWKGANLWVANAPDLTVVRDLDGDDSADQYVRVYTDLGNLEHGLHGLNFAPDGKLYMSKGNSKGMTLIPDRIAPEPFRELWGIVTPPETPKFPKPVISSQKNYKKSYHDPADDWGITGGILRCEDNGADLEIVSRGFRNPWDICFDDEFNWIGTDNDQTMGDKIFSPFFGAHFGWGHNWSYDWKGDNHLPTAPSSGPLFEGSGTGVIYCGLEDYPKKYRNVFFINDWLRREVYIYRPKWKGAWRVSGSEDLEILAHAGGGRAMPLSKGRSFDPVDIEMGPDNAIWISSWGRQYGAHYKDGTLANEGRIYRLWPKDVRPLKIKNAQRSKSISEWNIKELLSDLGSHVPAWRTNAQEELIRRGSSSVSPIREILKRPNTPKSLETWAVWTLGRMDPSKAWFTNTLNQKIQSLRIQAQYGAIRPEVKEALSEANPRLRLEAVLAIRQAEKKEWAKDLEELASKETDRIVFYAIWGALLELRSVQELKSILTDPRPAVRRAAILALLEQDALLEQEILPLTQDSDPANAAITKKRISGKAVFEQRGRSLITSGETPNKTFKTTINPFGEIKSSTGNDYQVSTLRTGNKLYTDRNYRLLKVPIQLLNEAFIQTSNDDADASEGIKVTVQLKYPSTLFLADDSRAEAVPGWARGQWEKTNLTLQAQDPKMMGIYKREFPSGTVNFGTNRDKVKARKSNYIVIAKPRLLSPQKQSATAKTVLLEMNKADPDQGRDLFLSQHGANCASCHQINNIGNNHAPELSDIGSRSDAKFLAESIVNPSASITEGFAAHMTKTKSGPTYTGIILNETGLEITMAMTGGVKVKVKKKDILERRGLPVSAMPANFASTLSSKQIADIVAYLLTQKKVTQKISPPSLPKGHFKFNRNGDNRLELSRGGIKIATYLIKDPKLTRRAFINLKTLSGVPVTRLFPAQEGEDHAEMHPGLWMSFGWISGNDYWRLQSKVIFDNFLKEPKADEKTASFSTRNRYLNKEETKTICIEDTSYEFKVIPQGILLQIDATYYNNERDFEFGDQEESGLALRMAKPLTVQFGNGRILNDRGDSNGSGTWGKEFQWIDYSGISGINRVGLMIVPHPKNPRLSWSHSRDYGVLVANPFPKQPKERREPYVQTQVKQGERFRIRYRVLIHESPDKYFDPKKAASQISTW